MTDEVISGVLQGIFMMSYIWFYKACNFSFISDKMRFWLIIYLKSLTFIPRHILMNNLTLYTPAFYSDESDTNSASHWSAFLLR